MTETESSDYAWLIEPIKEKMIRSVWRIVRDVDDFDDAFQNALETIWKRIGKVRRHPNPHALILRISANAAWDVLRKRGRQRRRAISQPIFESLPDPAPSAAQELMAVENRSEVRRAVLELPRNQAQAILMHTVQDLSYREIGQALGCSETTARTHAARARKRLAGLLAHLAPSAKEREEQ